MVWRSWVLNPWRRCTDGPRPRLQRRRQPALARTRRPFGRRRGSAAVAQVDRGRRGGVPRGAGGNGDRRLLRREEDPYGNAIIAGKNGEPPLIVAPKEPFRVKPEDPGGMRVDGEGLMIGDVASGKELNPEVKLATGPEKPVERPAPPPVTEPVEEMVQEAAPQAAQAAPAQQAKPEAARAQPQKAEAPKAANAKPEAKAEAKPEAPRKPAYFL